MAKPALPIGAARSQAGPRWRRWLANLLLVVVSAMLPALAMEIGLRLAAPPADTPGLFRKVDGSAMEWSGTPHAKGVHFGVPVSFNSLGLRDAERSPAPAPGTVRILALGDSVTFGMGVREADTFPRRLESLLNARPGPRVEVVNMGIPGYNTLQELAQLREIGLALRPKLVVVGYLYNDIEPSSAQRGRAMPRHEARTLLRRAQSTLNGAGTWLKHKSYFFSWFSPKLAVVLRPLGFKGLGQVGEVKDQYVDADTHWKRVREALLEMKRLTSERGIDMVVMIIPAMARFTDAAYPIKEYHRAVSAFCRDNGIRSLDLLPAFWGLDGTDMWILPTDGHPDATAHEIMAETLARYLAPLLPGLAGGARPPAL